MRILNRQYRGVDRTTDVLSFPQYSAEMRKCGSEEVTAEFPNVQTSNDVLGDIIINLHQAQRQSKEFGHTFNEELRKLLIHGLLHLIDYDHEKSKYHKARMERKEKELLAATG